MKEICGKQVYDTLPEIVKPEHTAVLIIDMQNDFCSPGGCFTQFGRDISMLTNETMPNLVKFLAAARKTPAKMVFIQFTALSDGRSDSPAWLYSYSRAWSRYPKTPDPWALEGTWGHDFCPGLEPKDGETIVKKHRSSAFVGTNLDLILRSNGIESLVVTGCVTHGCVLGTAMHGCYLDYYVVVAKDCVGSHNRKLHDESLDVMGVRVDLATSQDIVKAWSKA